MWFKRQEGEPRRGASLDLARERRDVSSMAAAAQRGLISRPGAFLRVRVRHRGSAFRHVASAQRIDTSVAT